MSATELCEKAMEMPYTMPREEKRPGVFAVGDRVRGRGGEEMNARVSKVRNGEICVIWDSSGRESTVWHSLSGFTHIPDTKEEKGCWHGFYEGERVKHNCNGAGVVTGGDKSWVIVLFDDSTGDGVEQTPCNLTRLSDEKPREWHGFKEGALVETTIMGVTGRVAGGEERHVLITRDDGGKPSPSRCDGLYQAFPDCVKKRI